MRDLTGLPQPSISYWERGEREPSLGELAAVEKAVGLPQGGLLLAAGWIDVEDVEKTILGATELDEDHRYLLVEQYHFYVGRARARRRGQK